jgi:hypothetical protein
MSLDEIKVIKPGRKVKITPIGTDWGVILPKFNPWIKNPISVRVFKNFIGVKPARKNEKELDEVKKILQQAGIQFSCVKSYGYFYLRIPKSQYEVINDSLDEIKMTTNDIRKIIQEELREMYEPQRAPIKPTRQPEREVEIMEPGEETEPKPRRRSLQPPKESPNTKPKALKEEDVVNKITKRFVNLKKDEQLNESIILQKRAGLL